VTGIVMSFILALVFSLVLTPVSGFYGRKWGLLDRPGGRKSHLTVLPRSGGLAVVASIHLALLVLFVFEVFALPEAQVSKFWALTGAAMLIFAVGLADDRTRINAKVKLAFQIAAASIAFWGGLRITGIGLATGEGIHLDAFWLSYPATVFWFVLITNAINLIDGLDGLAGGIVFLVSLLMVLVLSLNKPQPIAIIFAALGGATAGFLRYNFNPASIFLGDGGVYFLGFYLAGLSLLGSLKSHVGVALTIPLLALGVPIFDTLFAPLRRLANGGKAFTPDRSHIHHKLLEMGLTVKGAVIFIYMVTFALCTISLILVYAYNEENAIFLCAIGILIVCLFHFLGYYIPSRAGVWYQRRGLLAWRRYFLKHTARPGSGVEFAEWFGELNSILAIWDVEAVTVHMPEYVAGPWLDIQEDLPPSFSCRREDGQLRLEWTGTQGNGPRYGLRYDAENETWAAGIHLPAGYETSWMDMKRFRYLLANCGTLVDQVRAGRERPHPGESR